MKTWQTLLREHDPGGHERLDTDEARAIREAAIAAAREPRTVPFDWRPLAMAAVILLMVGTGVAVGRRAVGRDMLHPSVAHGEQPGAPERRQIQFSTPGGTRIIWMFDPNFAVKETIP
jgi:hypothetical protein